MSIKGTSYVLKKLKGISAKTRLEVQSSLARNTTEILIEAQDNTPFQTGDLWSSGDKDINLDTLTGKVFFGGDLAPYAPYVEFGTGEGFSTDPSLVPYASQFIKGPGRNAGPQAFLFPAFFKYRKIFLKDMRKIAKNIGK